MAVFEEGEREQAGTIFVAFLVVELKAMVIILLMVLVAMSRVMVKPVRVSSTPRVQGGMMDIVLGFVFVDFVVSFVSFTGVLLVLSHSHRVSKNWRNGQCKANNGLCQPHIELEKR